MSTSFDGFVLRKPKVASSNSPFTSEPDTLVLSRDSDSSGTSDRDEYLATFVNDEDAKAVEFLVIPANTGNIIAKPGEDHLSVFYTKNDEIDRFGFDPSENRWKPKPGSKPDNLGLLPESGQLNLKVVESDLGEPRITIGSPSETPIPVEWEDDDQNWPPPAIPPGEAIALISTGEIYFASDIVAGSFGMPVYQFRNNFFNRKDVTGVIGIAGEDLFLNPIPSATERPLIRSKYGSYLDTSDISWDTNTGELTFLNSDYEGEPIYYDGVYSSLDLIDPYESTDLAVLSKPATFLTPVEVSIDTTIYDVGGLILYVKETGLIIEDVRIVEEFSRPYAIPESRAEAILTGTNLLVRLSSQFVAANDGNTLAVGTGDYYLENGITFRMFPSLLDPSNTKEIPDAQNLVALENEVISDSVNAGTFSALTQIPLQDIPGYDDNTFFRLEDGAIRRVLEPNKDVVYDFDSRQIRWASPVTNEVHDIRSPSASLKLNNEVILASDFEFTLDEGAGPQIIEPGQDVLIDFDGGQLFFSEDRGRLLYEGIGSFTTGATQFSADNTEFDFDPIPSDPLKQPLLIIGSSVYRIEQATINTLTTHIPIAEDSEDSIPFRVIDTSEVVFNYALRDLNLNRRWIYPEFIYPLSDGEYIPDGESFSFLSEGNEVDHIVLESQKLGLIEDTLEIPVYYRESEANYTLLRNTFEMTETANPVPDEGEFYIDPSNGELTFNVDDIEAFPDAQVILEPSLSDDGHPDSLIEVLSKNRTVGIPSSLDNVKVVVLLEETQYTVQKANGSIFFDSQIKEGTRLRVRYYTDGDTEIIEDVGFQRKETLSVSSGQSSATFAAGPIELDDQRDVTLFVNGSPTPSTRNGKTLSFSPISGNRLVQVNYHVTEAGGGEKLVRLLQKPFFPDIVVDQGLNQTFYGDHRSVLQEDTVIFVDDQAFRIDGTPTYDPNSDITSVGFIPSVPESLVSPAIQGTSDPVTEFDLIQVVADSNSSGDQEIGFFGDVADLFPTSYILTLDGAPYHIDSSSFDEGKGMTKVGVRSDLLREYTGPDVQVSEFPVYPPNPSILQTDILPFITEPHYLVRFDEDDKGHFLEDGIDYRLINNGSIILDPVATSLPKSGEVWHLGYLGRRELKPIGSLPSQVIFPRVKASYTRFVSATTDNGIEGSRLVASYSFRSPDSFYFRALPLEEFSQEVSDSIGASASSLSSSNGPTLSFGLSQDNQDRGSETLIWEGGDLRDRDRVARRFVRYYNQIAQGIESYFQILDGRVVGDRDGQFSFFLGDDGESGGEDPVTGDLIPYYANPDGSGNKPTSTAIQNMNLQAQSGYIRNSIDDLVLTSKKPYEFQFDIPPSLEFEGTFKQAWEPHRLSRFYPQLSKIATVTPPSTGAPENEYTFLRDFQEILGDLKVENVLSVTELSARPARGWLKKDGATDDGGVYVEVGMSFPLGTSEATNDPNDPPNLEDGDPSRLIPGFKEGDIVSLGRVNFSKDPTSGAVTLEIDVYASNMEIAQSPTAGSDRIYLKIADDIEGFPVDGDDPADLLNNPPLKNDTLFVQSQGYFRQNFDYGMDSSEGELVNATLPSFIASVIGQEAPEPFTFLDATVVHKNQRTEPYRFPALDGEPSDDGGLTGLPYSYPITDSEIVSFQAEIKAWEDVINETDEGIVETAISLVDDHIFRLDPGVVIPSGHSQYNEVILEGVVPTFHLSQIDGNDIILAAFSVEDTNVGYEINLTGGGTMVGTGTIVDDLHSLKNVGTDFSGVTGTLTITSGDRGVDVGITYDIASGENGLINVLPPTLDPSLLSFPLNLAILKGERETGNAYVELPNRIFFDPQGLDIDVGDQLIVSGTSPNGGLYEIQNIEVDHVVVSPDTRENESNSVDLEVPWKTYRPRRFSNQLNDLRDELAQRRIIYQDDSEAPVDIEPYVNSVTSSNPSTPSLDVLRSLVTEMFGTPSVSETNGQIVGNTLTSAGSFSDLENEDNAYVMINNEDSRGFYRVASFTNDTIDLVDGSNFVQGSLEDETNLEFEVFEVSSFSERTYELILYEYYNVLDEIDRIDAGIRATIHDLNELISEDPSIVRPGDPADTLIQTIHLNPIDARKNWIVDEPSLRNELEAILKGTESLYDLRFAWIDFRINLEDGLLPAINRFKKTKTKKKNKLLKELIKLASMQ